MKVKVEVYDNETGEALTKPVILNVDSLSDAMAMVDETWLKDSEPTSQWDEISLRANYNYIREWYIGSKIGLRPSFVTTQISTI